MKIITPQQMQELDRRTQDEIKIPAETLMLNAGRGLRCAVENIVKTRNLNKKLAVFSGKGNNAGDAFCLISLIGDEYKVKLFMLSKEEELSPTAKIYFKKIAKIKNSPEIITISSKEDLYAQEKHLCGYNVVLDGLLGTGFKGELSPLYKDAIDFINSLRKITVSIDIPSGLNAEKGLPSPAAVCADCTVTMGFPKTGMFINDGPDYCGNIKVVDIGIPQTLVDDVKSNLDLLTKREIAPFIKRRKRVSHKGDYGHVLVLAGSVGMTGAGYMAAMAALRGGAGLVTIGVPWSLYHTMAAKTTEAMVVPLPETKELSISPNAVPALKEFLNRFDAVLLGPGISTNAETIKFVHNFVKINTKPLVIDADGLNALSKDMTILKNIKLNAVLTPHMGEFSRLTGQTKDEIIKNKWKIASEFALKHGVTVVLKGYNTAVTDGFSGININSTGNPGMATAGMGDVLSGIIASFIGQGLSPFDAAKAGVYIHGLAGDLVSQEIGEAGMIASDVISKIPLAIKKTALNVCY